MEFDANALNKIKGMSPEELSAKISDISKALGIDERLIKRAVGSPEEMKRKLEGMGEGELKKLTRNIDENTLSKLKDRFEG